MPKKKPIRRKIHARSRSHHMTDALGQGISGQSLRGAIAAWNQLSKSAKFDCGPQDYDCMAKEILQSMGVTGESNARSGVIECRIVVETPSIRERRSSILFTSASQDASTASESFGSKAAFRSGSERGV